MNIKKIMIPKKIKDYLDEFVNQEVYVQIALVKGKEKITTKSAISKYFNSNHFKDLSNGKPYNDFIDGLLDKRLGKLKNSPMRNNKTNDKVIKELQNKLNDLSNEELDDTFWEIETGEFLTKNQIKELEINRDNLTIKLNLSENKKDEVIQVILSFCKSYEVLCQNKYPEAPLPLEILKLNN